MNYESSLQVLFLFLKWSYNKIMQPAYKRTNSVQHHENTGSDSQIFIPLIYTLAFRWKKIILIANLDNILDSLLWTYLPRYKMFSVIEYVHYSQGKNMKYFKFTGSIISFENRYLGGMIFPDFFSFLFP